MTASMPGNNGSSASVRARSKAPRSVALRVRHAIEYAALRMADETLGLLPYRAALALAWGLAAVSHWPSRRRPEAYRRIRAVYGAALSKAQVRRIAWISWRNLFFNAVEIARFPRLDDRWMKRHADFDELDRLRDGLAGGRGAIVAVPHAGNWDLAGIVTLHAGLPIFSIARRQKNPWSDAWLNRMRSSTGMGVVLNDAHLLRSVLRRLRGGMLLALLPDVRARSGGLPVPFLNGTAYWGTGAAVFARQTGALIFPAIIARDGWSRHRLRVFEPIAPDPALDKATDVRRMTVALAEVLNRVILDAPEQYFWYNKRWVLDPPDEVVLPTGERSTAPSPAKGPPRPLVLLDIDGTLLHARGGGRLAFQRALQAEFGWADDIAHIAFAGATDLDILRRIFQRHGLELDEAVAGRFFRRLALELDAVLAAEPPELLPGARELLAELNADPEVLVGLVTGNTGSCAHIKLRHAGLRGHFVIGAFGHEHADRTEVARLALRRARECAAGRPLAPVVLIGDTPADVAAARAIGATAVAVATGPHDAEALRRAGADRVLENLGDLEALRPLWRRGP